VDAVIRKVPRGKLITVGAIRKKLAAEHGADVTCPLTTGIFIRIAAEAAEEARAKGAKRITPYWRVRARQRRIEPKVSRWREPAKHVTCAPKVSLLFATAKSRSSRNSRNASSLFSKPYRL